MNKKVIGGGLLILGIVLVVVGVALMGVIVPGMKQFPDDVDTIREYTGTMPVLLNAQTFEFMTDLDVDLERHFRTEETDDGTALVYEAQTLSSGGQALQQLVKHYSIDRKTMEWTSDHPADWAEKEGFWERSGLAMGWPIDTDKKDYPGWSDDYRDNVPLVFSGEEKHDRSGLDVYLFTSESGPREIDPEQVVVVNLPLELPVEQFAALIENADVSATMKSLLPALLSQWDQDTIPLQYYYEYEAKYWIEPQSGVLIDTWKHELRKASLGQAFVEKFPALANLPEEQRLASRVPIFDLTYQGTDETVQDAKKDAQDAIDTINLFGKTVPIVLIIAGILLGVGGGFLVLRKSSAA